MSLLNKLTDGNWYCDICQRGREYDEIDVLSYKIKDLPGAVRNLKYCGDDPSCAIKANQKSKTQEV